MKESYTTQNTLELKPPSRSSPPFYAKQRTLSPSPLKEKNKMDIKVDYAQLPVGLSLWPISRIPCPRYLRENYSEQPWRRTGPLKMWISTYAYIYLLFSWVSASAH